MTTPHVWHCGQSAPDCSRVIAVKSNREAAMRWLVAEHAQRLSHEKEHDPHRRHALEPEDRVTAIVDTGAPFGARFTDGCDTYYIAGIPVEDS